MAGQIRITENVSLECGIPGGTPVITCDPSFWEGTDFSNRQFVRSARDLNPTPECKETHTQGRVLPGGTSSFEPLLGGSRTTKAVKKWVPKVKPPANNGAAARVAKKKSVVEKAKVESIQRLQGEVDGLIEAKTIAEEQPTLIMILDEKGEPEPMEDYARRVAKEAARLKQEGYLTENSLADAVPEPVKAEKPAAKPAPRILTPEQVEEEFLADPSLPAESRLDAKSWLGREYNTVTDDEEALRGMTEGEIKLYAKIKHHIALSGLDEASKRLALQRLPLWQNSCRMEDADALLVGMKMLNRMFDTQTINILQRVRWGNSILKWVLDCLTYLPRLLWWCIKWVVHQAFGDILPIVGEYQIWTEEVPELEDWCSDFWSDKVRRLGNELRLPRNLLHKTSCAAHTYYVGVTTSSESIWCARTCIHNECKSLVRRQLLDAIGKPEVRQACWKLNLRALNSEFPCPVTQEDLTEGEMLDQFLEKYPLSRRESILRAFKLSNTGHYYISAYTKAFVKREWNVFKQENKRDPRCISAKMDEYLAESAPQYYHMMKSICRQKWSDPTNIIANREKFIYTGGLTPDQIGELVSHFEQEGYHFYEGDYSRYDGHNEVEALDAEFAWYALSDDLKTVLKKQLKTQGGTMSGIRFSHAGKVASGVINTSFGNTIRGFMMVAGWCMLNGITDYVVMQLGDDNILMFKKPIDLQSLVDWCTDCGHKLEIKHTPDVDLLQYCNGYFWNTGTTRVLGPKVGRVLSKTFVSQDPSMKFDQLGSYVQQVALGMRYYTWVPVLGNFLWKLMEKNLQGQNGRHYPMPKKGYQHCLKLRREIEVDNAAVAAHFFKIYGFDPTYLEDALRDWEPKLGTHIHHPLLDSICVTDGCKDPILA